MLKSVEYYSKKHLENGLFWLKKELQPRRMFASIFDEQHIGEHCSRRNNFGRKSVGHVAEIKNLNTIYNNLKHISNIGPISIRSRLVR